MKGKVVFEADEKGLHVNGQIMLRGELEAFKLVSLMAKCVGVNSPESWARCVLYCVAHIDDDSGVTERTEIRIPVKRDESDS